MGARQTDETNGWTNGRRVGEAGEARIPEQALPRPGYVRPIHYHHREDEAGETNRLAGWQTLQVTK